VMAMIMKLSTAERNNHGEVRPGCRRQPHLPNLTTYLGRHETTVTGHIRSNLTAPPIPKGQWDLKYLDSPLG
jgi:hypothetical protein